MKVYIFEGNESVDQSSIREIADWSIKSIAELCRTVYGDDWESSVMDSITLGETIDLITDTFGQAVTDADNGGMTYFVVVPDIKSQ